MNVKIKELQLREQNIKQMVPVQAYNKLKAHLNLLVNKHQAFRDMIINGGNFNPNQLNSLNNFNGAASLPALNRNDYADQSLGFGLISGNLPHSVMTNSSKRDLGADQQNNDIELVGIHLLTTHV
jgi:hypothetical protein